MRVIDAIKSMFATLRDALVEAVNTLTEQVILVSQDGNLLIQEPVVQRAGDKITAIGLAFLAALLFYMPIPSPVFSTSADLLMRSATRLWAGAT